MSLVRLFDTLAFDSWNPFSIFGTTVAADAWLASDTSAFADTYIESRETAEAYVFSATLPAGVRKEEVKVEVDEGNVLVITGERSVRREAKSDRCHHIERSNATFFGRFHLPDDAVVDHVRAAMDAGVLTVAVPKLGAEKAEAKAVEASLPPSSVTVPTVDAEKPEAKAVEASLPPSVNVPKVGADKLEAKAVEASSS